MICINLKNKTMKISYAGMWHLVTSGLCIDVGVIISRNSSSSAAVFVFFFLTVHPKDMLPNSS